MLFSVPDHRQAHGEHAALRPWAAGAVYRPRVRAPRLDRLRPSLVPARDQLPGGEAVRRAVNPALPSTVPARPVRDVLRGPGQPLATPVLREMEARLGAGFSDVRVHTDDAAHQAARAVSARAFTAGSHVAFRRGGYDPGSAAGKRTLAHELAHVVQQRSGPVDGTPAGHGIRLSDPGDRFELAAEATARRAMADGRRFPEPVAGAHDRPVTPAGEATAIQRRVGYEFEIPRSHILTEDGKRKSDTKEPLAYLDANGRPKLSRGGGAYISADNGYVEYVTDPLETEADVKDAVGRIVSFHKQATDAAITETITALDGANYRVYVGKGAEGLPQASFGINLESIGHLFKKLNEWQQEVTDNRLTAPPIIRGGKELTRREAAPYANARRRVAMETARHTTEASSLASYVIKQMPKPTRRQGVQSNKATGFLALIFNHPRRGILRVPGRGC